MFQKRIKNRPVGVWIALLALLLSFVGWIMQAYSLFDWENAVKLGLQTGSFLGDAADNVIASKEHGEAIADMIWPLPIAIIAFYGLLKNKLIGFVASMMEFAICVYFPLFYIFQSSLTNLETVIGAVVLWAIPSLFGIVGLWSNRSLYKV